MIVASENKDRFAIYLNACCILVDSLFLLLNIITNRSCRFHVDLVLGRCVPIGFVGYHIYDYILHIYLSIIWTSDPSGLFPPNLYILFPKRQQLGELAGWMQSATLTVCIVAILKHSTEGVSCLSAANPDMIYIFS